MTGALSPQDERELVDRAPGPFLAGLHGAEHGVVRLRGVAAGVPVGRGVAAADLPAGLAHPQVHPAVARLQALLAAGDLVRLGEVLDLVEVRAGGHQALPSSVVAGSRTLKTVRRGSESTVSAPSWRSTTIRRAVARPSPVPCPTSLVV